MPDNIKITMEDVRELLRQNPIAAEQIKVIALRRILAERDAEIEELEKRNE